MSRSVCQIPTNFRRYKGYYWEAILLAIRECLANAATYRKKNAQARIWWVEHNGGIYMVFGHNGLPFATAAEIEEQGCTPLQSGQQLYSLNGAGLGFAAAMLRTECELIVASKVQSVNRWCAARCWPNRQDNTWDVERCNDWADVLKRRLTPAMFDKFSVFYIFRLEEERLSGSTAPLNEQDLSLLSFLCPSYIGEGDGHRWSPDGSIPLRSDTAVLRNKQVYKTSTSGSKRRKAPTLAEFLESYCSDTFELKVEPFEYELDKIEKLKVRIHSSITACAYPTEKEENSQWLARIRDAKDGEFKKGSRSSPGAAPRRKVMLTLSAAKQNGDPKFARFADNVVWTNDAISEFMNACGFQYLEGPRTPQFATLQFDISKVEKWTGQNWVEMPGMEFANKLEREADFTLRDPVVRDILLRATDFILEDDVFGYAKLVFEEMFPYDPEGLVDMILPDKAGPKTRVKLFDIYDLETGEQLERVCESGELFDVVIVANEKKTLGHRSVRMSDIQIPTSQRDSFTIQDADKLNATERKNLQRLKEELGMAEKLRPLRVEVSYMEAREDKDEDWEPIGRDDYVIGSVNCRPRRNLSLVVGKDGLSLVTVTDVPERDRKKNNEDPKSGGGEDRKTSRLGSSHPYCARPENLWCEVDKAGMVYLNAKGQTPNPLLRELFTARHPKAKEAIRKLYQYINERLGALTPACRCLKFDTYEALPDDEKGLYKDQDKLDYLVNKVCEFAFLHDPYVQELIAKIRKQKEKYESGGDSQLTDIDDE